jgi:hypothetical protein
MKKTALLLLAVCLPAHAGDWPCRADVERLCMDSADKGACLEQRLGEVSPACREFKEKMRREWQARGAAKGEKSPGMQACLEQRLGEVSPACREFKEKMRREWQARGAAKGEKSPGMQACMEDAKRLCPGADDPGKCVHEHIDEVSEACRAFKQGRRREQAMHGGPEACREDLRKFCDGVERPGACIEEHLDQVSPACREFKEKMRSLAGKPEKPLVKKTDRKPAR